LKSVALLTPLRSVLILLLLMISIAGTSFALNEKSLAEQMYNRYGDDGRALFNAWRALINQGVNLAEQEQLNRVNDFFNRSIAFRTDLQQWQQQDYWATPLETLGVGAADCEDYTIAKYITLLKLGVPGDKLRLIYVKAQIGGQHSTFFQAHMVLGFYPTPHAEPLILDNLITTIEPAGKRPDLRPVFSFNDAGLWIGRDRESRADPGARLSRWRDVLTRMRTEGFHP
jgi:predicted transglutaminase-like cysteine proteinase